MKGTIVRRKRARIIKEIEREKNLDGIEIGMICQIKSFIVARLHLDGKGITSYQQQASKL